MNDETPERAADGRAPVIPTDAQARLAIWVHVIDRGASVLIALFKWGAFVLIAHYAYLIFLSLSGKLTSANVVIDLLAKFGEHDAPLWIVAIVAIIYGYLERRERKHKTETLAGRIRELEKRLDPDRTSSGLMPDGETNKEDLL